MYFFFLPTTETLADILFLTGLISQRYLSNCLVDTCCSLIFLPFVVYRGRKWQQHCFYKNINYFRYYKRVEKCVVRARKLQRFTPRWDASPEGFVFMGFLHDSLMQGQFYNPDERYRPQRACAEIAYSLFCLIPLITLFQMNDDSSRMKTSVIIYFSKRPHIISSSAPPTQFTWHFRSILFT